jgi:hypothetical protein
MKQERKKKKIEDKSGKGMEIKGIRKKKAKEDM